MGEVIEGRMTPMPSDPAALRAGTRSVLLTTMAIPFGWAIMNVAYLAGGALGHMLTL